MAFLVGLGCIVGCVAHPLSASAAEWLVGISWFANPAFWVGGVYLVREKKRNAVLWGSLALVLATCAIGMGYMIYFYYIWLLSMFLIVLGGSVADGLVTGTMIECLKRFVPEPGRMFGPAIGIPAVLATILLLLLYGEVFQPNFKTGEPEDTHDRWKSVSGCQTSERPVRNPQTWKCRRRRMVE